MHKVCSVVWCVLSGVECRVECGNIRKTYFYYRCNQHARALGVWQYISQKNISIDSTWIHSLCCIAENTEGSDTHFKFNKKTNDCIDERIATGLLKAFKEKKVNPNLMDCTQLLQVFTHLHIPFVVGEILEIIKENGIQCDTKAWAVIIAACSQSRSLGIGKLVHQQIQQERKEHVHH